MPGVKFTEELKANHSDVRFWMNPSFVRFSHATSVPLKTCGPAEVAFEPETKEKPEGSVIATEVMFKEEFVLFTVMLNMIFCEPASTELLGVTAASKPDAEHRESRIAEQNARLSNGNDLICILYNYIRLQ